jgi:hypothetical protein
MTIMDHIVPLHDVDQGDQVAHLVDSMTANGWVGRPLLIIDTGERYQAITGSHRIQAARIAGVDPDVEIIDPIPWDDEREDMDEISDLYVTLSRGCDSERYRALEQLQGRGLVTESVVRIMAMEIEQ